jgi:hypothetical protein
VTARYFVVEALVGEDVVGGDLASLDDDEAVGELRVVEGEPQRPRVGLEAGERRLAAERLVRLLVVVVIEEWDSRNSSAPQSASTATAPDRPRSTWFCAVWLNLSILPWPSE